MKTRKLKWGFASSYRQPKTQTREQSSLLKLNRSGGSTQNEASFVIGHVIFWKWYRPRSRMFLVIKSTIKIWTKCSQNPLKWLCYIAYIYDKHDINDFAHKTWPRCNSKNFDFKSISLNRWVDLLWWLFFTLLDTGLVHCQFFWPSLVPRQDDRLPSPALVCMSCGPPLMEMLGFFGHWMSLSPFFPWDDENSQMQLCKQQAVTHILPQTWLSGRLLDTSANEAEVPRLVERHLEWCSAKHSVPPNTSLEDHSKYSLIINNGSGKLNIKATIC